MSLDEITSHYTSQKHAFLTFNVAGAQAGILILWQSGALMPGFSLGVTYMKNYGVFYPLIS